MSRYLGEFSRYQAHRSSKASPTTVWSSGSLGNEAMTLSNFDVVEVVIGTSWRKSMRLRKPSAANRLHRRCLPLYTYPRSPGVPPPPATFGLLGDMLTLRSHLPNDLEVALSKHEPPTNWPKDVVEGIEMAMSKIKREFVAKIETQAPVALQTAFENQKESLAFALHESLAPILVLVDSAEKDMREVD
jgi:hypothetical protein